MGYENYNFVSWTDGTPVSSDRLAQMSMNMEQIRDSNDGKPSGVLEFIELTTANVIANVVATSTQILALTNPDGGSDQRVTIDQNRYYKVTCVFPGFTVAAKGAEDATLTLQVYNAVSDGYGATTPIIEWNFSPSAYVYANVAANASVLASELVYKTSTNYIGAGTYSGYFESGGGLTSTSFSIAVKRTFGASNANNAPAVAVNPSTAKKLQLIVEDVGASV